MPIHLRENNYGKQLVRVLRVDRQAGRHEICELSVGIRLEGDFDSAHIAGDNSKILPTDTMKNTVYALARQAPIGSPEEFCLRLLDHFFANNPQISRAHIEATETLWSRLPLAGSPHPHTFTQAGGEKRSAVVTGTPGQRTIRSGVADLIVLKTTASSFEGFLRDSYTTLKEDRDRILSTIIRANWLYRETNLDFDSTWTAVRQLLLETFAGHDSQSLQQTLYAMGEAVLQKYDAISEIHLSLPNKHYNLVDLSPFHLDNPKVIFLPTSEPHGLIEATLRKS